MAALLVYELGSLLEGGERARVEVACLFLVLKYLLMGCSQWGCSWKPAEQILLSLGA